jgi:hypothetical protein
MSATLDAPSFRADSRNPTARTLSWVALALAACALALSGDSLRAQAPVLPVSTVIERAAAYVTGYGDKLASVVAQERYDQEVRYAAAPGSRSRDMVARTTLQSDFLLVRNLNGALVPFRDVFERNGTAVRDRDERLSALLLDGTTSSLDRARRISEESARYNIGNIERTINVPTLALEFLTDVHRRRFVFETDGSAGDGVRVVRYEERTGPTYIQTTNNRDLPVSGRYWIDEATGRVQRSELKAVDAALDALITVTYRLDEAAGFWVPDRMEEVYKQKNDGSEIRGNASYVRYRRFSVTTTDEIAK